MHPIHAKQRQRRMRPKSPFSRQHLEKPGLESKLRPRPPFQVPDYKPAGKLLGKVALITGGDSGIGRAVTILFAREGAKTAIVYLPYEQSDAEETRRAVEDIGGQLLLIPGDVTDSDFCREAVNTTVVTYGQIDILVNNAAYQQHTKSLEELTDEQWDRTFKTNIYGYFHMAKEVLPYLKRGGTIINTGSITGLEGSEELLDYSATKGAIQAFTKSLARSVVKRGIRVNCIAPGPGALPDEIAPSYVFLASEADSRHITGEVLTLLGGGTMAG